MEIGTMAFYQCSSLKKVDLPRSLKKLGNNVFTASGIKSAVLKADLSECGMDVFSQCKKLKSLTLEERVSKIGDKFAFSCPLLENVSFPSSLCYIGRNALEGSYYLEEFIQNEGKEGVIENHIFLDGRVLSGDVRIPEGVVSIAGGAFYGNSSITSVLLPESLQQIGARAFCNCSSLKEIVLPHKIDRIEEGTFAYDGSLERVMAEGEVFTISDFAFYRCENLKEIFLEGVKEIGKNAFAGCKSLENIVVTVSRIEEDAFLDTVFLEKQRKGLEPIQIAGRIVDGKECEQKVVIPEGVVSIAPFAFAGNEKITHIVFPNSLISIEEGAFYGCRN